MPWSECVPATFMCVRECSVVSDSLQPHGRWPTRLLSMGVSKPEYPSGLLFPPPGDLPDPGVKPTSPESPALQADSLPLSPQGSPDSCAETLMPRVMALGGRPSGKRLGHEGGPPLKGISPRITQTPPAFCGPSDTRTRHGEKSAARKRPSPCPLTRCLGRPGSRTVRHAFLRSSPSSLWCFVITAQ